MFESTHVVLQTPLARLTEEKRKAIAAEWLRLNRALQPSPNNLVLA